MGEMTDSYTIFIFVRFEVFIAMKILIVVFWVVFINVSDKHLEDGSTLFSETLVTNFKTTSRVIEDEKSHLNI